MLSYLEVKDGFISLSQQAHRSEFESWVVLPNQVQLRMLDVGVIEIKPAEQAKHALVVSCGVHGNETAPIEIVSEQISQIVKGIIQPKINLLYILGNPESMKLAQRFSAINMNRLFAGGHSQYTLDADNQYELTRAANLEKLVQTFFQNYATAKHTHLDLHTAIKPSFHKTFAIRPFSEKPLSDESRELLVAMGIEAVLQHNKPSTTFSYFTCHEFKAEAYTLELGKVKPFGENNIEDFAAVISCLNYLVEDRRLADQDSSALVEYKVVAEIIKHSEDFKFHVKESVENFTHFPQGSLIAEDFDFNYRVAYASEAVVFPNVNVPVGQRVAVMVTRSNDE